MDSDKIRLVDMKPQKTVGWEAVTAASALRALHAWRDNSSIE